VLLLPGKLENRPATTVAAFLAPGHCALKTAEPGQRLLEVLGTVERRAVAERQRVDEPHVNTHGRADIALQLQLGLLDLEADVPARRLAQEDDVLDRACEVRLFGSASQGEAALSPGPHAPPDESESPLRERLWPSCRPETATGVRNQATARRSIAVGEKTGCLLVVNLLEADYTFSPRSIGVPVASL
jgi:hypothetical protein